MKQRVLTALVLAPVVLGALFLASPWPIRVLAALAAFISCYEISGLTGKSSYLAGVFGALALLLIPTGLPVLPSILAVWVLFALGIFGATRKWAFLAVFWAIAPLYCLLQLHDVVTTSVWQFATPVLLAIVPLWGGDTAAIFAGKAFGKHLLAPTISPKKTVEGSIANLIACVIVGVALSLGIGTGWPVGVACGFAAGTLGQAGDLFESYIKRQADVKDSGTLLPGHGGLLDRIDSILFTAPAVLLIIFGLSR
ncbi:phosphatidate cytidylyltransferase [soil metagenome]